MYRWRGLAGMDGFTAKLVLEIVFRPGGPTQPLPGVITPGIATTSKARPGGPTEFTETKREFCQGQNSRHENRIGRQTGVRVVQAALRA